MEVLICTRRKGLRQELFALTDKLLCKKKARCMSVNTNLFQNKEALIAAVKKYKGAVVVIDTRSFPDWESTAAELESMERGVCLCIVTGTADEAAEALNRLFSLQGCAVEKHLERMYAEIIEKLCGRIGAACGGIAAAWYGTVDKVIPFGEVYYIETVKRTHMCSVVHRGGRDRIRADLSKLITELDPRFQFARSSAIVNLSAVSGIENSRLFFPDGSSVQCTEKYAPDILPAMKKSVILPSVANNTVVCNAAKGGCKD